ncbi:MAG: undecaprenyl-phosphate galactose phosphotransferase WbaP [Pontiellaceae bacterium]|nr:undecaprenyl-phosphate galactose phosphotransferase WbaP [Pontiellaceae bacterium]MBN2784042.1 undecaprenyl-phosphate galactose phosphotransferase WbaP [Pontiellaceae bacterium]
MKRDIVSVDASVQHPKFYRRIALNSFFIMLGDALMVAGSLCLANLLLLWIKGIPFSVKYGFLIVPLWTIVSVIARLVPGWGVGVVDELRRTQGALFIMFVTLLLFTFVSKRSIASSRIIFLSTYVFCAVLIPFVRAAVRGMLLAVRSWGIPAAIYGDRESVLLVAEALRAEPSLGYIPAAVFTDSVPQGNMICGVPVLGHLRNTTYRAPVAIMALGQATRHQLVNVLEGPLEVYRRVILIPDLKEAPSLWVTPRDLQGILGLEITKNLLNPFARIFKRFSDLFLVLLASPLWIPLMTLLYLLIWLEDRHNPLFLQPRVGRGGGTFRTAKFRTMVPNAEKVLQQALKQDPALKAEWEANFKLRKDPRITKVGNFLRKTSLDEIPQLLNVIRGTMSLVGPRPLPAYHFNELSEQVRFLRHKVQPGITGLWQVSGRSESGNEGMEKWDPYYVRNWSIWLDIVILARTIKAVVRAQGAY